jgi:hypothetical protein
LPASTTSTTAATGYYWNFTGSLGTSLVIDTVSSDARIITVHFNSTAAAVTGDGVKV